MPYTPNNPYIPGDPYSYDLKWIVDQLNYAISLYEPLNDKFDNLYDFVHDYFDNLDVTAEVQAIIDDLKDSGYFDQLIYEIMIDDGKLADEVTRWLAAHITQPTTPAIDTSLTISGAAADAKAAGDAIKHNHEDIDGLLFDYAPINIVYNSYYDRQNNGAITPYTGWNRADYIEVTPTKRIIAYTNERSTFCSWFDENYNQVSSFTLEANIWKNLYPPTNAKYVGISGPAGTVETLRVKTVVAQTYYNELDSIIALDQPVGIIPFTGWERGSFNNVGQPQAATSRLRTGFIAVKTGGAYQLHFGKQNAIYIYEYDISQNFIRGRGYYTSDRIYTMSKTTAFVRFLGRIGDGSSSVYPEDGETLGISMKPLETTKLKVMTYNVGHYSYGVGYGIPDAIYDEKLLNYRRFFGNEYPDVIGFQEYNTRMDRNNTIWADDVLWDHFYDYEMQTGNAAALKSKVPLADPNYAQFTASGRYYVEGYVNGIYVMSVHLAPGVDDLSVRLADVAEILTKVSDKETFIVFGDFNAWPGEEDTIYGKFTDAGYQVANRGFFGNFWDWTEDTSDFDNYNNPTGPVFYTANIVCSADIKITNVYPLPGAYDLLTSDHIPLVAEIEI